MMVTNEDLGGDLDEREDAVQSQIKFHKNHIAPLEQELEFIQELRRKIE
jgi:hypothetical protein